MWLINSAHQHKTADGFVSSVILRARNPKTHELADIPPIRLPPTHKHLAAQPTAVEARHFAATYALFRVCSMKNIHMMMPPAYRDLWKGDFQDLKQEDVAEGKGWMYEADPFQVRREREEAQVQKEKKREMHEKERAAKAAAPGGMAAQLGTGAADLTVGWKTAPKIEMGKKTRKTVEELIRKHADWNVHQAILPSVERHRVVEELSRLGFRPSHVEEAASVCKDREEILEWLLIHIPEDDLPRWSLPEGYVAGIVFASGDVKREGVVKRLSEAGYAVELCEEAYDGSGGNELVAAQKLQHSLFPDTSASEAENNVSTSINADADAWAEEQTVLSSIYEAKCDILSPNACQIRLDIPNFPHLVTVKFQRPRGVYPNVLPVLTVLVSLPAYIRLSITKKALTYARDNLLGQQMIFNLVDWIEAELPNIVANPGRLSEVASAGSATAEKPGRDAQVRPARRAKRARPIDWQAGTEQSRRLLAAYTERQNDPKQQQMLRSRQSLPAWNMRDAVVAAVTEHQVVIISGETGSGKSTQSVQFVLDDMIQRQLGDAASIICTQPRRISALGLADRVAEERCSQVGQEVGYVIRGESKRSQGVTKIVFVTTGVLLRRMQTSGGSTEDVVASLADISHVVVDEVHERSLDTDFLLALLRDVLRVRKDLKVILMSATLDADVFERYFSSSASVARVEISGRTYPVEDIFLDDVVRMTGGAGSQPFDSHSHSQELIDDEGVKNLGGILRGLGMGINYELIANVVREIDRSLGTGSGAILIFLPGTMEISRALDALRFIPHLHALPLHASLLPIEQRRVFPPAPRGSRKVICSTNVAETSITIEDVVAVIDTGRVKETCYDPTTSMVRLEEVWASRAACKQRRGRAGRVSAGRCYKLYTRAMEARMAERPDPEIRRVPLEQLCLSVKAMGVADVRAFLAGTLTPPESTAIEGAHTLLRRVGALDGERLTPLGRHLAMIPADLRCAKLMVHGALFGCLEACVTMASILTARSPFVAPRDKRDEAKAARRAFGGSSGDVVADLHAYDAYVERRRSSSSRDVREWCEQNFLSQQTLRDVQSTRIQYLASLKEIGFLPINYQTPGSGRHLLDDTSVAAAEFNRNATSMPLLEALLLSALHPQTLRISLPTQKYAPTVSGTLAVDPEAHTIKFFDDTNARTFLHP